MIEKSTTSKIYSPKNDKFVPHCHETDIQDFQIHNNQHINDFNYRICRTLFIVEHTRCSTGNQEYKRT